MFILTFPKFHGSGVRYEIALCIQTGLIVWTNGPYPCGKWSDISIFRHKLKKKLGRYEYAEADKGYRGDRQIASPDEFDTNEENVLKFDVRARHETVNRRMKDFAVLRERFRHHISKNDMSNHEVCFNCIAVVTQLNLHFKPLYPIYGYNLVYHEL